MNSNHPSSSLAVLLSRQRGVGVDGRASRAVGFRAFARWRLTFRARRAFRRVIDARDATGDASSAIVAIVFSRADRLSRRRIARARRADERLGIRPRASREPSPIATASSSARRARETHGAVDGNVYVERRHGRRTQPWFTSRALERRSARSPSRGAVGRTDRVSDRVSFFDFMVFKSLEYEIDAPERCLFSPETAHHDSRVYHDHLDPSLRARVAIPRRHGRATRAAAPRRRREHRPRTFRRTGPARSRARARDVASTGDDVSGSAEGGGRRERARGVRGRGESAVRETRARVARGHRRWSRRRRSTREKGGFGGRTRAVGRGAGVDAGERGFGCRR